MAPGGSGPVVQGWPTVWICTRRPKRQIRRTAARYFFMNWPRWTDMYGHHILWVEAYKSRYTLPRQGVWSTSNQILKFRILRLGIIAQSGTKSGLWGPKIMKPPRARTRMQKNHENRSYASETQSIHCPWALQSVLMYLEGYHRLLASLGSFCIFNLQLILVRSIWGGKFKPPKAKIREN